MVAALPLVAFALLFTSVARRVTGYREAFLTAALLWGLLLVGTTEGLSLLQAFTPAAVAASWAGISLILTLYLLLGPKSPVVIPTADRSPLLPFIRSANGLLVAALIVIAGLTGFLAVIATPMDVDSMAYHMPRVRHWIQQQGVQHYATGITRQIGFNPGAEFAIAQVQMLTGSDRFANAVQWVAMVGSLLAVSLIAPLLGGSSKSAVLATVAAGTIPMGILQASSTQNDYVEGFWLLCLCYFLLRIRAASRDRVPPWSWIVCVGLSLGLAILTKGTAYMFAFFFMCWFSWLLFRRMGRQAVSRLSVVAALVILINAPHVLRNWEVFHSIGGEETTRKLFVNQTYTDPVVVLSNVVRSLSTVMATGSADVNYYMAAAVRRGLQLLGADANDPRSTWAGYPYYINWHATNEAYAGSPLHLLLTLTAALALLTAPRCADQDVARQYLLCIAGGFLLFSFLAKWQLWHNRLLLPLMLLCSPLLAAVWSRLLPDRYLVLLATVLLLSSLPAVLLNETRPLIGAQSVLTRSREEQYFTGRPEVMADYRRAVALLGQGDCTEFGLWANPHDFEYPFWVLLDRIGKPYRFSHVGVWNESAFLAKRRNRDSFQPCAVLMTIGQDPNRTSGLETARPDSLTLDHRSFRIVMKSDAVNVYVLEHDSTVTPNKAAP